MKKALTGRTCKKFMWKIKVNGKVHRVTFWKWLAYSNQKTLERIEVKLDKALQQRCDKGANEPADNSNNRTD